MNKGKYEIIIWDKGDGVSNNIGHLNGIIYTQYEQTNLEKSNSGIDLQSILINEFGTRLGVILNDVKRIRSGLQVVAYAGVFQLLVLTLSNYDYLLYTLHKYITANF